MSRGGGGWGGEGRGLVGGGGWGGGVGGDGWRNEKSSVSTDLAVAVDTEIMRHIGHWR